MLYHTNKRVGTADKTNSLRLIGRVKNPLKIYIKNIKKAVLIRLFALDRLSHLINLGQTFLHYNNLEIRLWCWTLNKDAHNFFLKINNYLAQALMKGYAKYWPNGKRVVVTHQWLIHMHTPKQCHWSFANEVTRLTSEEINCAILTRFKL